MKKVIDGAVYNTDTATELATWYSEYPSNDFHYCKEKLYRTKAGKYFLYGSGGALSRYGEWTGNTGHGSEKIMPMSVAEARLWAETNLSGEEYASIFGEPEEAADDKVIKSLSLSSAAAKRLEQMQSESGLTQSSIVERMILGD